MQILKTIAAMRHACTAQTGTQRGTLGLVPTMGALHEGHLSLIRAAKQQCDRVAVSIFVNPTQFAPSEDFAQYPRTFERDCELLEQEGVDFLFAPSAQEMYPNGLSTPLTFVEVPNLSDRLDGRFRPGHLRAVATVVAKLFHIVSPDLAYFGQKDAAQVAVIQAMVRDLDFPLQIVVCPTVREPDGLALSSRNRYLTPQQREDALALPHALATISTAAAEGTHDSPSLIDSLTASLTSAPGLRFEYAEIVNPHTLEPAADLTRGAIVAIAAWAGTTRLIDNLVLPPMGSQITAERNAKSQQEVSA